ncbi:hypothetical protein I6M42_21950 [Shewanella algae]|uniref:hypothetical protein n=1 Tax=Shewanella algae TaxID=38313 RepID=UPI001AAFD893|nr:hypothetical protein [Shewanella algae]MBO2639294.1 hypothetical protein [Shewanella algae]
MSNDKIADLKAKFVDGAIPLESDYAKLLDMLEETRAATGTSPDAQKSASLRLSDEGYLDVAVAADGGIVTGASGLSTDARVLWAINHAILTKALQYGIWSGGYVFIYNSDGGIKVQFCVERGWLDMFGDNSLRLLDEKGKLLYETYEAATQGTIPGWTERPTNKSYNTIQTGTYIDNAHTLQLAWSGPEANEHRNRPSVLLHSV